MYIYIYSYLYTFIHTYTHKECKINSIEFLFPQTSYNIRFKAVHILNTQPHNDDITSLFKRVPKKKHASKVSDLNRLFYLLVLTFAISISSATSSSSPSSSSSRLLLLLLILLLFLFLLHLPESKKYSTDIYSFIEDSIVLIVMSY